jgi:type I restriction enzyme, S subunit
MTAEIEPIIGIPETWISVKIGDLAIVKGGKRLPKGVTYSKEKTPFPYIRVTDFKGGSIDTNNLRYITKEIRDIISRYTISSSDIYISIAGTIGVVGMVPDELDNANLTENAAKIVLCKYIDSQYIYRLLDSPLIQQQIETQTISTTQPKLALFRIESLEIPLPPLNEQRRIVSKIEQLTERSNKARVALEDVPKLIAQFRQSVLAAAFRGDLTADWREKNPDIESASELVQRIHQKRINQYEEDCKLSNLQATKKTSKPCYLDFDLDDELKQSELSLKSWIQVPVGLLCDCIVPGRDKPKSFTGDIPWITIPDLISDEIINSQSGLGLSEKEIIEVKAKIIPIDSVIMSCVGRFGITSIVKQPLVINQQLHAFLKSEMIDSRYLMYFIIFLKPLMGETSTSTTVSYLNKTNCNNLPIFLPPIEEQEAIIQQIDYCFNTIKTLENHFENIITESQILDRSILAKAFRGELVPQDPNDEPAAVLLERIRAEREQASTPKQRGKTTRKNSSKQLSIEGIE